MRSSNTDYLPKDGSVLKNAHVAANHSEWLCGPDRRLGYQRLEVRTDRVKCSLGLADTRTTVSRTCWQVESFG